MTEKRGDVLAQGTAAVGPRNVNFRIIQNARERLRAVRKSQTHSAPGPAIADLPSVRTIDPSQQNGAEKAAPFFLQGSYSAVMPVVIPVCIPFIPVASRMVVVPMPALHMPAPVVFDPAMGNPRCSVLGANAMAAYPVIAVSIPVPIPRYPHVSGRNDRHDLVPRCGRRNAHVHIGEGRHRCSDRSGCEAQRDQALSYVHRLSPFGPQKHAQASHDTGVDCIGDGRKTM